MRNFRPTFTLSTFAKRLGYENAGEKGFRKLLKLAILRGLVKIQQGGFKAHSMCHPRIVVLMKPFEEVRFIERAIFPSYILDTTVDGYRLVKHRTGIKRLLKSGKYSKHEWWICEKCGRKIRVGQPYAHKVEFSKRSQFFPVKIRCVSCFVDMVEDEYMTRL